jgi:hypothetical protein
MAEIYGPAARASLGLKSMSEPVQRSRGPVATVVEGLKALLAGLVGALMALVSGLLVLFGILLSVLPLLLVLAVILGGVYLIVH